MNWDEQIKSRLDELRRKLAGLEIAAGFWSTASWLGSLLLLAGFVEFAMHLPPAFRRPLFGIMLAGCLAFVVNWLVRPWLKRRLRPIPPEDLALRWGRSLPRINDRLLNALQVWENRQDDQTSPDLAELALRTVAGELQHESYERVLDPMPVRKSRKLALFVGGFWLAALIISQGGLVSAFGRILQPGRDFGPAAPFALMLENVPRLAIRGEPLNGTVVRQINETVLAVIPEQVTLTYQEKLSRMKFPRLLTRPAEPISRSPTRRTT